MAWRMGSRLITSSKIRSRGLSCALIFSLASTLACTSSPFLLPPGDEDDARVDVVALAGPDLVVREGSRVVLSGRASRALGGDPVLSWSQLDGPPVLLTNPSSALPAFVAPFAPATLVFELRAEADGRIASDEVRVAVEPTPVTEPGYLVVPEDAVAAPSTTETFLVETFGAARRPVTISARASCAAGGSALVDGDSITVVLPLELPCAIIVDGVDADGKNLAPAARVFWPQGTTLPGKTDLPPGLQAVSGAAINVTFGGDDAPSEARAWPASGDPDVIPGGVDGEDLAFSVPRRLGRVFLGGERRLGGASGGVQYTFIDVTAGSGNLAPQASGGSDRIVQPGARFRLDATGTDVDGDTLEIIVTQVLGDPALADGAITGAFIAPEEPGELLFHVEVDDGAVRSAPDTVRVLVSEGAENQPPTLVLPATRFVIPGQFFVVDGSAAEDPDSGFIAGITIAQDLTDPVVLLAEPREGPFVQLVAGAAGETYRFSISAFDEDGLGVTVQQEVIVEEAGPYVDPARGDDSGNGTAATPFATVEGALATAIRHELPELLLAIGTHAPLASPLPDGLSLRGGVAFDGTTYVDIEPGDGASVVPGGNDGPTVVDARLASLTIVLDAGTLTLRGTSALDAVTITNDANHLTPLLVVASGAAVSVRDSRVLPLGDAPASIVAEPGATLSLIDSVVEGDGGSDAVGIACTNATVAISGSTVIGGRTGPVTSTGVRATDGCSLDATNATIVGGASGTCVGIDSTASLVSVAGTSRVVGVDGDATSATAVRLSGRERSALLRGTLLAVENGTATEATGVHAVDAQVSLVGAVVDGPGALGVGVRLEDGALGSIDSSVTGGDAAIRGADVEDIDITGGQLEGVIALDVNGPATGTVSVDGVTVEATSRGISAGALALVVRESVVVVTSDAVGTGVESSDSFLVSDSSIDVSAAQATAVALLSAGRASSLERSVVHATGTTLATAVFSAAPLTVTSSFVSTLGAGAVGGAALAFDGTALTLRHATLVAAGGPALRTGPLTVLDAANSILAGSPGLQAEADAPWERAIALAFDDSAPFVITPTQTVTTEPALDALECDVCRVVDMSVALDATGHLTAGDNALVDAADPALSPASDVDGDVIPQGSGPDIGCDERL